MFYLICFVNFLNPSSRQSGFRISKCFPRRGCQTLDFESQFTGEVDCAFRIWIHSLGPAFVWYVQLCSYSRRQNSQFRPFKASWYNLGVSDAGSILLGCSKVRVSFNYKLWFCNTSRLTERRTRSIRRDCFCC